MAFVLALHFKHAQIDPNQVHFLIPICTSTHLHRSYLATYIEDFFFSFFFRYVLDSLANSTKETGDDLPEQSIDDDTTNDKVEENPMKVADALRTEL